MAEPHLRTRPLRVAVIGAGYMGNHHLRVLDALKNVELVAVVDPSAGRAAKAASAYGCLPFTSSEGLVGIVEAATVAAPSSLHAEIGIPLLEGGVHLLVEKPLALDEAAARALIDASERSGATLAVGHVERFNPVVHALQVLLPHLGHLHALDFRRMSSRSFRVRDVDVVADLMVHDLDIARALLGDPIAVDSVGVRTRSGASYDHVSAVLTFPSGALATLTASRITQNKIRRLEVTSSKGFVTADYLTQELHIFREGRVGVLEPSDATAGYTLDVAMERVFVRTAEPLVVEIAQFVDAVRSHTSPLVTGEQALKTLRLVWEVQSKLAG